MKAGLFSFSGGVLLNYRVTLLAAGVEDVDEDAGIGWMLSVESTEATSMPMVRAIWLSLSPWLLSCRI
jgi:hypothetical protein